MEQLENIMRLLQSGIEDNILLAEQFIIGNGLSEYFENRYSKLLKMWSDTMYSKNLHTFYDLFRLEELYLEDSRICDEIFDLVNLDGLYLPSTYMEEIPKDRIVSGMCRMCFESPQHTMNDIVRLVINKIAEIIINSKLNDINKIGYYICIREGNIELTNEYIEKIHVSYMLNPIDSKTTDVFKFALNYFKNSKSA
jgi:hypothetical protein